jgi:acetyl-CoA acetyltransferase
MAASVIREIVQRADLDPALIEEVILGCANQAGEDNRNIARMSALLAGLPVEVAGVTVNRLCASGLSAVNQAARAIKAGEGEVFIAGGVEAMSRAPYSVPKAEAGILIWKSHRMGHRARLAISESEDERSARHTLDG